VTAVRSLDRLSRRTARARPMSLAALLASAPADAIDLALGVPPGRPPERVVSAAVEALRTGQHQYIDAAGLPSLRQAVADELRRTRAADLDPDREVTITCGSTNAAMAALLAVTDPGDEVLIPQPYFENHPAAVDLVGARPVFVPLTRPGWRLDPDALRQAVGPRTRAVLISTPHNPTGRVFDDTELAGVLELCRQHELICITDETYDRYVYDGRRHVSPLAAGRPDPQAIVCGSLSKSMQVSGWRIGWCAAPADLMAGVRAAQTRMTLGAATPLQHAVLAGLGDGADDSDLPVSAFEQRRNQLVTGLRALGFTVEAAEGGWFLFAGVPRPGYSAEELTRLLAQQAGLLLAPGTSFFDDPADGAGWVRLSLVRDAETTERGLRALGRFLAAAE
jgi:aspartate/methionine/tyrosine aminotransferase